MKLIISILLVACVNSLEPSLKNNYFGKCEFVARSDPDGNFSEDDEHITFECIPTYGNNSYFTNDENVQCASEFNSKLVSKSRIVEMHFINCSISTFTNSVFEVYTHLSILNISGLGLETLQNELFQQAYKLTQLNVSNNNLVELQPFRFTNAKKLEAVDLSFNKIHRIDSHAFVGNLTNLKNLTFSHNNITHLPYDVFNHLPHLERLNLSNNGLNELNGHIFNSLTHLKYLDLSYNPIDQLNKHLFTSSIQLKHLYLSHTKLKTIEAKTFARQEHLEYLDVTDNNLKVLDIRAFDSGIFLPRFDSLQTILIARNQLVELNGFTSSRFPFVKIIGIDENQFDCCYLEQLLRQIQRNQLELSFDENTFHPTLYDAKKRKCEFGNDFVYPDDRVNDVFDWTEAFVIICMLLFAIIIGMASMILKQNRRTYEKKHDPIEIQCDARINDNSDIRRCANSNVYDLPKY